MVFLNAHKIDWQSDPNYLFRTLGDRVSDAPSILQAIDYAKFHHGKYTKPQRATIVASIDKDPKGATSRGAKAILTLLDNKAWPLKSFSQEKGKKLLASLYRLC